jgi:protein subunit release factor B
MMSGEYFLSEKAKERIQKEKKREQKANKKVERAEERNRTLMAPEEEATPAATKKYVNEKPSDMDALKNKFLAKRNKE